MSNLPLSPGEMALSAAGKVADIGGKAVDAVANSATTQQDNSALTKSGPADTYPQGVETTKALVPSEQTAEQGVGNAATIEKNVVTPVAQGVKEGEQATGQDAQKLVNETHDVYSQAVAKTNEATLAAEAALKNAANNAAIDPQQYLHQMGTDQKVMSSIGMVLSGIGSGLTGQPNLAMQMYQKNTDRAIAAQQAKFQNLMTASLQSQGLLRTAQDRQMVSSNAYNMAVVSQMNGNITALQGAVAQAKSQAAEELAKPLYFMMMQQLQQATDNHNRDYINTMQSGDVTKINALGALTLAAGKHFNAGFLNRFTLSPQSAQNRSFNGGVAEETPPTPAPAPTQEKKNSDLKEKTGSPYGFFLDKVGGGE